MRPLLALLLIASLGLAAFGLGAEAEPEPGSADEVGWVSEVELGMPELPLQPVNPVRESILSIAARDTGRPVVGDVFRPPI